MGKQTCQGVHEYVNVFGWVWVGECVTVYGCVNVSECVWVCKSVWMGMGT